MTESDRIYFLCDKEIREFPTGEFRTLRLIKVDEGGAYLAACTREIAQSVINSLRDPGSIEAVSNEELTPPIYVRPMPFRVFLLPTMEVADLFLRTRGTFASESYILTLISLRPLAYSKKLDE